MIFGNTEGIKNTVLNRLEELYESKVSKDMLTDENIINVICQITDEINREISVSIDRKGQIISVAVGDSNTVEMPEVDIKEKRLSGIRIVHTHPNGNSYLSALDLSALIKLKLDCIAAVGVEKGKCNTISLGFCSIENDIIYSETTAKLKLDEALKYDIFDKINYIEEIIKHSDIQEDDSEKAILVGIDSEESLEELNELAKACNIKVADIVLQKKNKIDTAFYIGRGKVEELALLKQAYRANLIIFDDELSGSQVRNLEEMTGVKVIDRTTLILEIFARRAKSREAKIQVEAAQLKYRFSRLGGLGTVLSRTGGGIGTKGPGEKKLEIDRRRIRETLYDLYKELEKIKKTREVQRDKRNKEDIPKISLVGYTNAGKSTLRNKLCNLALPKDAAVKKEVFEADMLFATLDVTTRAITLLDNRLVTITDTVGFIRKLPHDLVEAFKSTLEEVVYSDLLLHVVDVSSEYAVEQIDAVNLVLKELKAQDKPILIVLNKIDAVLDENVNSIKQKYSNCNIIEISAKDNINLDGLLNKIGEMIPNNLRKATYLIPYVDQSMVSYLHRNSKIDIEEFLEDGTYIEAQVDEKVYNKCLNYLHTK